MKESIDDVCALQCEPMVTWLLGPQRFSGDTPWGAFAAIGVTIAGLLVSMLVVIAVGFLISILWPGPSSVMSQCLSAGLTAPSPQCGGWILGFTGLWASTLIAMFYGLSYLRGGRPSSVLQLRPAGLAWWRYAVICALLLASVVLGEILAGLLTGVDQAHLEQGMEYVRHLLEGNRLSNWLLLIFVVVIAGPAAEELVFRGFLFSALAKGRLGFIGAAAITSFMWTMLHYNYNWQLLLVLFVFGVLLAYLVWRTGSLWPALVSHGVNNLFSVIVLALR